MRSFRDTALLCLLSAAFCIAVGTAWAQTAATPPSQESTPTIPVRPAVYSLQTEDVLKITVRNEPDFSAEQVVDPSGNINMPQLGQIHAEGLTQQELTDKIAAGLTTWVKEPKVQITISQFRRPKISVTGYVNRPGVQEFKPGDRIMDAIAGAGSFSETAYPKGSTITHKGSDKPVQIDLDKLFRGTDMTLNYQLQDGDSVYVPEDLGKYYVLGEVIRPGMFRLKDKVSVIEAISTAGGPSERGSLKTTYIIRGDPKTQTPQRIKVDVDKITKKGDLTQNLELQTGDVVYVAESTKPNWGKIAGVLSTVVNSSYLFRLWGL